MTDDPAFVWTDSRRPAIRRPYRGSSPPEGGARSDPPAPPTATEGAEAVLVPLDQWSRILNQLGNLHEAGQQLAEARERAAKAETEAVFLRDRLREVRERAEQAEARADVPPSEPEPMPEFAEWFTRRWLERRRRKRGDQ